MSVAVRIVGVAFALAASILGSVVSLKMYAAAAAFRKADSLAGEAMKSGDMAAMKPAFQKAAEGARRSIDICPRDPEAHNLLATIAAREARHADAVTHLCDSLRLDPFDANRHYYLGRALGELGRREEAQKAVATAAELGRNHPALIYWAGYYHWSLWRKNGRMVDLEKSFDYFRKAAEGDLGYLDKSLRTIESFSMHYDNVVQLIPDTPAAHHMAGRYMGYNRGLWEPALEEFRKAGDALEDNPGFRFDRGLALLFTKADPLPDFRRALETPGTRQDWTRKLLFYFRAAHREEEARSFWIELEEAYPDLPAAATNRVEMEMVLARAAISEYREKTFAEMRESMAKASTTQEKKAVERFFMDKLKAEYARELAPTEAYLRERIEKFRDGELLGLLGDVLDVQDRVDEAESAMKSGAETGNTQLLWKKYIDFLIRRGRFDAAWTAGLEAQRRFPSDGVFKKLVKLAQDRMLGEKTR